MKISSGEKNVTINLAAKEDLTEKLGKRRGSVEEKKQSIFAGDIDILKQEDKISDKKTKAQRQALKSLMTAYNVDKSIDDMEEEQLVKNKELEVLADEATKEMENIDDLKEQAKEKYGIEDDSQEQKDLELLLKQKAILNHKSDETLTEEEMTRLQEMGPVTEYQKEMLEYEDIKEEWGKRYEDSVNAIKGINRAISAIEVDRLKSSPMVSASKEAEEIMKAASKEIIGMLKDEAVKHIDEKIKEEVEKAEEIKEKKEEEEAKKQEEVEKKQASEVPAENVGTAAKIDEIQSKLEAELRKMKDEILSEDIKGLKVDKKA